jgi:hypothetical protein
MRRLLAEPVWQQCTRSTGVLQTERPTMTPRQVHAGGPG